MKFSLNHLNRGSVYLLGFFFLMLTAIYFVNVHKFIGFYITILLSLFYLMAIYHKRAYETIDRSLLKTGYFIILLVAINIFLNVSIDLHHVLVFIYIYLYFVAKQYKINIVHFVRINNIHFIVYLILSILVYSGVIQLEREINIFEVSNLYFVQHTFIGFSGSTASIDSYAMFTFLVNLIHNENKRSKYVISLIALLFSLLTFRFTPVVALFVSVISYLVIKNIKSYRLSTAFSGAFIFFLTLIPFTVYYIIEIIGYSDLSPYLIVATNGRSTVWVNMLHHLFNDGHLTLKTLFGISGVVEVNTHWSIVQDTYTDNPHNSYLNIFSRFGFIGIAAVVYYLIVRAKKLIRHKSYIIVIFILITAITNTGIFYYHFSFMVMYLMLQLNPLEKKTNNAVYYVSTRPTTSCL